MESFLIVVKGQKCGFKLQTNEAANSDFKQTKRKGIFPYNWSTRRALLGFVSRQQAEEYLQASEVTNIFLYIRIFALEYEGNSLARQCLKIPVKIT